MQRESRSGTPLAGIYKQTLDLRAHIAGSSLDAQTKANLLLELDEKIGEFQSALEDLLGLDLWPIGPTKGMRPAADFEAARPMKRRAAFLPAKTFKVHIHTSSASVEAHLAENMVRKPTSDEWKQGEAGSATGGKSGRRFRCGFHLKGSRRCRRRSPSLPVPRSSSRTTTSRIRHGANGRLRPGPWRHGRSSTYEGYRSVLARWCKRCSASRAPAEFISRWL